MKPEDIEILIKHRLEQAQEALDDAKYLIDGKSRTIFYRSKRSKRAKRNKTN